MVSTRRQLLEATWSRLGVDVEELEPDTSGTFGRTLPATGSEPQRRAGESVERVELGAEIGRGGMGVVHQGTQVSLGREVAVKSVRPELGDREALELLNEARITGALEHPAIVPIYGISRDDNGRPLILMKQLTGESWHDRIRKIGSRRDAVLLDDDIGVLVQVCNAVAFAHERGVLHRDIKPANILLGDFGEVYLVDWGLAVDYGGADIDGLPTTREVDGVSGSVFYMAPEQALGVGEQLGPHTDIFLLGATLFELVSGRTVRGGGGEKPNFHQLLLSAYSDDAPPLPDWVPIELREICARALAREPSARFASVREFREALVAYLAHRESRQLEANAVELLARATEGHARGDTSNQVGRDLAAARFGFEQALRGWPANPAAKRGREAVLLLAAEREILARRPNEASTVLALLETNRGNPRLNAEVAKLRERLASEHHRSEALAQAAWDSNLGAGAWRLRGQLGLLFGGLMLVTHAALAILGHLGVITVTHLIYLTTTSAVAAIVAAPTFLLRRRLTPNRATTRFMFTLAVMLLAQVAVFVALWSYETSLSMTLAVSLLQLAGSLTIKTSLLDRRALWTSAVALAMAGLAIAVPALAIECVGVAYSTYFIAGGLLPFDEHGADKPEMIEDLRRLG